MGDGPLECYPLTRLLGWQIVQLDVFAPLVHHQWTMVGLQVIAPFCIAHLECYNDLRPNPSSFNNGYFVPSEFHPQLMVE